MRWAFDLTEGRAMELRQALEPLGGEFGLPMPAVVALTLLAGAAVGLVNGILVGFLRLRACLTMLVTLIVVRAVVDMLWLSYSVDIAATFIDSAPWYFLVQGLCLAHPHRAPQDPGHRRGLAL